MDFKELESFVMIAKVKSFSKAADKLFLTQPALSNHISKLEKELGVTLLMRNNKKTELTHAGQKFYISALEILNQREFALLSLEKFQGKIDGILQIATSSVPGQYILPNILKGFHEIYKDVTYNHYYLSSGEVISLLLSGELDFGFIGAEPEDNNIIYEKIADDELVVIAPNVPPFSQMESITFERLLDEQILLRKEGSSTRRAFDTAYKHFTHLGKPAKVLAHMDNNEMIALCVKAGFGVSIASRISVEDKVKAGFLKVLPLEDYSFHHAFYFAYPKKRTLSPMVTRFKEFVLEQRGVFDQNEM
ncbi:MAG: LysR family transcriptional regulator [Christensenellaceae bacterium]|jgi:DNA-binding transcriptional LysR family regulator|nr:LysR family transcriptional regulator [Christensenellaceae bacterium]